MFKKTKNALGNFFNHKNETKESATEPSIIGRNIEDLDDSQSNILSQESVENLHPIESKPYSDWRGQIVQIGWNLRFSELIENQIPIADSLIPAEQLLVLEHNSKLDDLKLEAAKNSETWYENNFETLLDHIIEITIRLSEVVVEGLEVRKTLAFYLILAGLATNERQKSTKSFEHAVKVMERILSDFPELLTAPDEANFREDVDQAYNILEESDPQNKKLHRSNREKLHARLPENERKTAKEATAHNKMYPKPYIWTEARFQIADKLWTEGATFSQIISKLGGLDRNRLMGAMFHQKRFRQAPNIFEDRYKLSPTSNKLDPVASAQSSEEVILGKSVNTLSEQERSSVVIGPEGTLLILADLPPPQTVRWTIRLKAEVVTAVRGGLLTEDEALERYGLTKEEFTLWKKNIDSHGVLAP